MWDSNIPTQPLINSTSTSHTSLNVYSSSALNLKTNVNPTDIHKVGFYLLNPIGRGNNKYCYFHTVTILNLSQVCFQKLLHSRYFQQATQLKLTISQKAFLSVSILELFNQLFTN